MNVGRPISEEDLHGYVDGALDAARQAEIAEYLTQQPEVAIRVAGYVAQRQALRAALRPIADEPVPPELSLRRLAEMHRRPPMRIWLNSAAALVLLIAGGAGGWSLHGMMPGQPSSVVALVEEAADSFRTYGGDHRHPVEFKAAESAELVNWVSDRFQRPVSIPDLTASGYRFMGGRLVPTSHGPAAMFMYDNDRGTRLTMLMRPVSTDADMPMAEHEMGRMCGWGWAARGVGYSLVSSGTPAHLQPLATEIKRQIDQSA